MGEAFRPRLEELFAELRRHPKQFPKKTGRLADCRTAGVRFNRSAEWRCVFLIEELERVVTIYALGPHDDAYRDATKRVG